MLQTLKCQGANEQDSDQLGTLLEAFHEFLFENREQLLLQIDDLLDVLASDDMVHLYQYSVIEMGIAGRYITMLIIRYIIKSMENPKLKHDERDEWFIDII